MCCWLFLAGASEWASFLSSPSNVGLKPRAYPCEEYHQALLTRLWWEGSGLFEGPSGQAGQTPCNQASLFPPPACQGCLAAALPVFQKGVTDECFFLERLESNNYNTYRSRKYSGWYVALKRTGQYKLGPKTGPGQKAILFLPMAARS